MGVPFDHIATAYDTIFTNSAIGQLQRKSVWKYIESVIPHLKGIDILELNCGTGEDAIMFGERGFNIVATDISSEMLNVTNVKAAKYSMQNRISSFHLNLETFNAELFNKKFDLIFSNFGGLNCISPQSMEMLLDKLPLVMNPGGRFIAVVMPKFCLWESLYFLATFQFRNIFRRKSADGVTATLHGTTVDTWYYSPAQIKQWTALKFACVKTKPIGFFLPPSYMENFFESKRYLLYALNAMEKRIKSASLLSAGSDHFLIDLRLR